MIQQKRGDYRMKIQWMRVLLGGFLIELILAVVLIGGFAAAGVQLSENISSTSSAIIGAGCFAVALVVVLWLGKGITSQVVLHGLLIGLAATLLYVALLFGSGQLSPALAAYGPVTFVTVNALRILGAALGGVLCERRHGLRPATPSAV
jgi:hypothetical protein